MSIKEEMLELFVDKKQHINVDNNQNEYMLYEEQVMTPWSITKGLFYSGIIGMVAISMLISVYWSYTLKLKNVDPTFLESIIFSFGASGWLCTICIVWLIVSLCLIHFMTETVLYRKKE